MATEAFARETDTELAQLDAEREKASDRLHSSLDSLHYQVGDKKVWKSRNVSSWQISTQEVEAKAAALLIEPDVKPWTVRDIGRVINSIAEQREIIGRICDRMEEIDRIYRADPWPRYFPCLTRDGHIHSTLRGCSSVRWDTRMGWTPQLSGKAIEVAVAELGEALCTFCYPDAPSDWKAKTLGQVKDERTREERAAAKAAKEEAYLAKNLRPSEWFRDWHNNRVQTVAACKQILRDAVADKYWYPSYYAKNTADFELAAKTAREVLLARGFAAEELDKIVANAEKKARRESRN